MKGDVSRWLDTESKMQKMLVTDLDDTLLRDDLTISEVDIQAIKKAKDQGHVIMFCSGRSNDSMMQFIESMDIHDEDEYFISFNGARIDTVKGENIYLKPINQELMADFIDIGYEFNVTTQLYYDSHLVVEEENDYSRVYQERTNMEVKVVKDIKSLPYSLKVLYHDNDRQLLNKVKERIETKYAGVVNCFYSKKFYLEITHPDVNKGLTVEWMANHLGITRENVVCVGDGYNDVSMIEYAGKGCVVANASDGVKKVADYITKASNNEGGVAEVIERFILND